MEFGRALPRVRAVADRHLLRQGLCRELVLAGAVRLIDLGSLRPDGEEYAAENTPSPTRRSARSCGA